VAHRSEVDFATVVATALEASRPLIEEHGHHLAVSVPQDRWRSRRIRFNSRRWSRISWTTPRNTPPPGKSGLWPPGRAAVQAV